LSLRFGPVIDLTIVEGDLLDSSAQAIMLPVDGSLPTNPEPRLIQRSLGRIARAFARRHPECELVEEIDAQVSFPLAAGQVAQLELPDGSPFRFALLLSILAHEANQTNDDNLRTATAGAFAQAISLCDTLAVESVAAPLLKGGWRITSGAAINLMLKALASATVRHSLTVEIRILDEPGVAVQMRELARSFGVQLR
jgi:hypothetical protein